MCLMLASDVAYGNCVVKRNHSLCAEERPLTIEKTGREQTWNVLFWEKKVPRGHNNHINGLLTPGEYSSIVDLQSIVKPPIVFYSHL